MCENSPVGTLLLLPSDCLCGGTLSPAGSHCVGGHLVGKVGGPSSHKSSLSSSKSCTEL